MSDDQTTISRVYASLGWRNPMLTVRVNLKTVSKLTASPTSQLWYATLGATCYLMTCEFGNQSTVSSISFILLTLRQTTLNFEDENVVCHFWRLILCYGHRARLSDYCLKVQSHQVPHFGHLILCCGHRTRVSDYCLKVRSHQVPLLGAS